MKRKSIANEEQIERTDQTKAYGGMKNEIKNKFLRLVLLAELEPVAIPDLVLIWTFFN